jgi:hypothetical protein
MDRARRPRDIVTFRWSGDMHSHEVRPTGVPPRNARQGDLGLFQALGESALPHCREPRDQARFVALALQNPVIRGILKRMHELELDDCWLASGCLFQTVWNLRSGKPSTSGIRDYDIIYFDPDQSWDAENEVIQRTAKLFADIDACIEIRNQARVHLWYESKFGKPFSSLKNSCHSLWRYPSRTSAIALRADPSGHIELYAPFGIRNVLDLKVRPNRRTANINVYWTKAQRWSGEWPGLSVESW